MCLIERTWTISQISSSTSRNGERLQTRKVVVLYFLWHEFPDHASVAEIAELDEKLKPWTSPDSFGIRRADSHNDTFSIQYVPDFGYRILKFMGCSRCVGVFDTVGSIGLPDELSFGPKSEQIRTIFGFSDTMLGEHIARAYQALALDEHRKDFVSTVVPDDCFTRDKFWFVMISRLVQSSNKVRPAEARTRS